ncbi:uncharacterized protein LOC128387109 [Panonychus citri]|uniref:uncharacterized protein LOC128387109 n=1 Tax=Panonychus citri TaxID=50023 RepID=UPI002308035C|nr:uncharacterized protein LOC128387109 [Panonychus citri]XP_053202240.1 uncharacterized protein LOC128387109 [Panonychus citri]XP_053202241.1 uncharacterized protein LOC128387109 [Panonychus citri]XP_053202242.1 uncharacterized protein LOC128387109 [Panonychus citri]
MTPSQMAPGRGRKSSLVWSYVYETSSDSFQCVFCSSRYRRNATQIKAHLIDKCSLCPVEIKANLSNENERFTHRRQMEAGDLNDRSDIPGLQAHHDKMMREVNKRRQLALDKPHDGAGSSSFIDKTIKPHMDPAEEQEELRILFARAIYSSSLPYHFVENDHWKKFFHRLRPDFVLPSKNILNSTLLDNEYRQVMSATEAYLSKSECLTIALDGFSCALNTEILNIIICTPSPVFHSSVDTRNNPHTSKYIFSLLKPIIEDKGGENFVAILADNASEMTILGQVLRSAFPHLLTFGCASYCLNSLLDDISRVPEIAQIMGFAQSISTEIKRSQVLNPKFQEIAGKSSGFANSGLHMASLYFKSRYSAHLNINQLSIGKQILRSVAMDSSVSMDPRVREIILSADFWDRIDHIKMIFHTIQEYINIIELNYSPISDIPDMFRGIQERLVSCQGSTAIFSSLIPQILPIVNEKKRFLTDMSPAYFLANVLDPRKKGVNLSEPELQSAEKFLLDYARVIWSNVKTDIFDQLIRSFSNFTTKTGYFESDMVWKQAEIVGPLEWWKFIRRHESHRYLSEIGIKLLSIPCCNVTIDKILIQRGHQPDKRKSRSLDNRSSKLVAIRSNLHLLETVSTNPYDQKMSHSVPTPLTIIPDLPYGSESDRSEAEDSNMLGNVLSADDFHYEYDQQSAIISTMNST